MVDYPNGATSGYAGEEVFIGGKLVIVNWKS
jgi:hypothetical protein